MRALVVSFIFNVNPFDRRFLQAVQEVESSGLGWTVRLRELFIQQLEEKGIEVPKDAVVEVGVRVSEFDLELGHLTPGRYVSLWGLEKPITAKFQQRIKAEDMLEEVVVNRVSEPA